MTTRIDKVILEVNMEGLRKSTDQLLIEIGLQARMAELVPWFHNKDVLIWERPAEALMKVFGLQGDPASLFQIGERDIPGMVTYQEFSREGVVRMRISDHIFGTAAVIELMYDQKDGKILYTHREGAVYPANVLGSRWFGEDSEELLEENPEITLTEEQRCLLKDNERAKLISYYFFPHRERGYWRYGEGSARILYFWDRVQDKWIYLAHSSRDIGTEAEVPDYFVGDEMATIKPIGNFRLPREVMMTDFVEHLFFPRLVTEVSPKDLGSVRRLHDFIGVEKV